MIDLRAVLRSILLADGTVSGMVAGARVYPGILPQQFAGASLVQNLISEDTDYRMSGASGLVSTRVQIDAWAATADAAVALANAAKDCLSGYSGLTSFGSNSPQQTVMVQAIFAEQGSDEYDDEAKLHRRSRDYVVWHAE